MPENSNDVFNYIREEISKFAWWQGRKTAPDGRAEVEKLVKKTITNTHREYQRVAGDRDACVKNVLEMTKNDGTYQGIQATFETYEKQHAEYHDQHRQLKKIENAQGRRALLWRTTSTIAFASVIFFFYWLAGCLGVQLPLSRFGM